jgi:16S rRNA (adenine(1408)-N(1))-methyltransferase
VIGIDASEPSMRDAARRAARRKDGVPNAVFVVASVESLPGELRGVADRVTVQFPWGSLLRGILCGQGPVLANLASIAAPGAPLTILWSLVDRDRAAIGSVPERPPADRFAGVGLEVRELRPATPEDLAGTGSTWAKQLRAGTDRPVTLLRAVRSDRLPVQPDTASCR